MRMSRVVLVMALAGGLAGCGDDDSPSAPVESPAPATAPAPAPAPAEPPLLESATITVADQPYLLPPMVLRLRHMDDRTELLLSGHEKAEPTGNTLVLSMQSDAAGPTDLSQNPWTYQAPSDEWTDTNQGVTLRDERYVLRPFDVTVRFAPAGDRVNVTMEGTFLQFDTNANPELPGRKNPVEAQFDAALVIELSPAG